MEDKKVRADAGAVGAVGAGGYCGLAWPNGAQVGNASIAGLLSIAYLQRGLPGKIRFPRGYLKGAGIIIGVKMGAKSGLSR